MEILDHIRKQLEEIGSLSEPTAKLESEDRAIGTATDYEVRLWTLAKKYDHKKRQIAATMMMIENDKESITPLQNQYSHHGAMGALCRDLMWASIRVRLDEQITNTENGGIGIRENRVIVLTPEKESMASLFGKLKDLL